MGGQACVLYGAAEFSRALDLALLPDPTNLDRLQEALAELDAEVIAVPPFRSVAPFPELWARRRRDAAYWKPLREQLERLRREARKT